MIKEKDISFDNIKKKLSLNPQDMVDWEWGIVNFLLDHDRDFIIAPQYGFSLNRAIGEEGKFSDKEMSDFMNTDVKDINNIGNRAIKKLYRYNKFEDSGMKEEIQKLFKRDRNKITNKVFDKSVNKCAERKHSNKERDEMEKTSKKRGMRKFDQNSGMRYLIQMKRKYVLGDEFVTSGAANDMKWWDVKNLQNAAKECGRLVDDGNGGENSVYTINLSDMPTLKRGRKPKVVVSE